MSPSTFNMKKSALLAMLSSMIVMPGALAAKKQLIIDSDMLNFDDDPMAIGLANILQDWGQVELIGVMSSVSSRYAPPAMDAINTFYGHPDIPVAIQKPVDNSTQDPRYTIYPAYLPGLTNLFPEDVLDGSNTPDPVSSYRYLLSTTANASVTLAVIGYFDNVYHLLQSGPDDISPHTGAELLSSKVSELVVQANDVGTSWNTGEHNTTYAEIVLNWWPGKLTFASDDVGDNTYLGKRITTELSWKTNPVAYALGTDIGYNQSHQAWDVVAVYYAVCGLDDVFDLKYTQGSVHLNGSAYATWSNLTNATLQNSIEFKVPNTTFAARLENMLLWEPEDSIPTNRTWCKN